MKGPLISVVTVNWNRKDELLRLLDSLRKQTLKNFEVIVVDNASTDGSVQAVREGFPEVRILEIEGNIGVCASFNRGAEKASGEIVFSADTDCLVKDRELFKKIAKKFEMLPHLGIIACAIKDFDTDTAYSINPAATPSGNPEGGYNCLVYNGTGFAIAKRAVDEVGGYNESYFIYSNEMELSMKVIDAGYLCRFFPDIVVYHAPTKQQTRSTRYDYYMTRNVFWWQWQYFPLIDLAERGFGFGTFFLKVFMYKDVRLNSYSLRGLLDAILGLPKVIMERKPFSKKTMVHYYKVREEQNETKRKNALLKQAS